MPTRRSSPTFRAAAPVFTPGPGVDAHGFPVIDPTANVLSALAAAVERQDDLRIQESQHVRELIQLHAAHAEQLRRQEALRIDATRATDVAAVSRAAEVAATQAGTLASQVNTAAEAMRAQVGAAAQAASTALVTALEPIQMAISDLRKAQYEQQGQKSARTEGKETNQWTIALVMGLVIAVVQVFLHFLK